MAKVDSEEKTLNNKCARWFYSCRKKNLLASFVAIILIGQRFRHGEQRKHDVRYNHGRDDGPNALNTVHPNLSKSGDRQPLRILSMGGSVTWGSRLESRTDAYPYRIKLGSFVTNLALRASGSDYPSLCINSMVESDLQRQGVQDIGGFMFDLITIEFSLNGMSGIDLLLERLRKRYPRAIFIYVHLLSPRMSLRDKKTGKMPRDILKDTSLKFTQMDELATEALSDPNADWIWDASEIIESKKMESAALGKMKKIDGTVWSFPINNEIKEVFPLFTADQHHLNYQGHAVVAAGIRNILDKKTISNKVGALERGHGVVGSWGKGDFCFIWFETGLSPLHHTGGKMRLFVKPNKFAHHMSIGNGTSTISIDNKMSWPMPLSVMYMVWHPQYYPKTKVTITSHTQSGDVVTHEPFILNPIHDIQEMRSWHVTVTSTVGVANPGHNTIAFDCLEKTTKPLRVTGIVMCGACDEMTSQLLSNSGT